MDLKLLVKEGSLSIDCQFPSEADIRELPRVWLTGNKIPWNPNILESGQNTNISTFWDGMSKLKEKNTLI